MRVTRSLVLAQGSPGCSEAGGARWGGSSGSSLRPARVRVGVLAPLLRLGKLRDLEGECLRIQ